MRVAGVTTSSRFSPTFIEQVPKEDGTGWRILTNDENPDYRIKVRDWDHNGVLVDILRKDAT